MAPTYQYWDITPLTLGGTIPVNSASRTVTNVVHQPVFYVSSNVNSEINKRQPETKKERIIRISKERMYASWKTYIDKTETIKEIKQLCRPAHRINYIAKRF